MKIYEIKEMKSDELRKRIEEEEKNLIDLRFAHELKQLTNTSKLKIAKKDIARMKTFLHEREAAEQKPAEKEKEGVKA